MNNKLKTFEDLRKLVANDDKTKAQLINEEIADLNVILAKANKPVEDDNA